MRFRKPSCLSAWGGAFQPVGTDFDGASLQVLDGEDFVPGLKEALAAKN
jgi:hypothetical protein